MNVDRSSRLAEQIQVRGRERRHREQTRAPGPARRPPAVFGCRRPRCVPSVRRRRAGSEVRRRLGGPRGARFVHQGSTAPVAILRLELVSEPAERPDPVNSSLLTAHVGEALPEAGLPVRRLAALPLQYPVLAVEEALVEHARQAIRKLEPLARVPVAEVAADRALPRTTPSAGARRTGITVRETTSGCGPSQPPGRPGQEVIDTPPEPSRRVRLVPGEIRHHRTHERPRELRGLLEADVGRNAEPARKLQREPSRDGGMRDHDSLRRNRIAGVRVQDANERVRERLHPVRVMEPHSSQPVTTPEPGARAVRCAWWQNRSPGDAAPTGFDWMMAVRVITRPESTPSPRPGRRYLASGTDYVEQSLESTKNLLVLRSKLVTVSAILEGGTLTISTPRRDSLAPPAPRLRTVAFERSMCRKTRSRP